MYRLCSYTYCTVYCYRKQCFWTISVQMWIILLNLEITYIDQWTLWFACKQIKPTLSMKTYKYAACPKKFVPICSHTVCFVSFCRILLFHTVSTVHWVQYSNGSHDQKFQLHVYIFRIQPTTTHHSPLTNHHSHLTTCISPLTIHHSQFPNHYSPPTTDKSTPTTHHSHHITHQSLLTIHHSPLTMLTLYHS